MDTNKTEASGTVNEWKHNAQYWAKHSETIRTFFEPVTRKLIDEAQIREGQLVLDVACGAGEPGLTIAQRVAPTGRVTCTDAVAEMLAATKEKAAKLGLNNVAIHHCAAESLPFGNGSFDVAESRLGVMLFSNPQAAVSEMLRVIKPGGKLAFVVWNKSELNPFASAPSKVMARHVTSPAQDPDAPGAFRFAIEGKLAQLLSDAGAVNVAETVFDFRIAAQISFAEYWELRSETSGTLREKLATLAPSEVEKIRSELEDEVREYFPNGQMNFPASMIIVTGSKLTP